MCSTRYVTVVAVVVAVGVRSRQACARRQIPIPDRRVIAAARELFAVGTEAHGCDDVRVPPHRRKTISRLRVEHFDCAVTTPRRDAIFVPIDAEESAKKRGRKLRHLRN